MFRETFRAHSRDEYREFLTRGLGEDKRGLTGTYPWLYIRIFFILFILFTVNIIVIRFTGNTVYVPMAILFGGITVTIPFMVLLYEMYQKRDLNSLKLLGIAVLGGTVSALLSQLGYELITVRSIWLIALISGLVEEISKALVAIAAIMVMRNKNSYACFLIACAVGAGFSIIEDMGYIFHYSDLVAAQYGDIRNTVYLFIERGLSTFCTHILWTGIVGLAYGFGGGKYRPLCFVAISFSIFAHTLWNAPLEGWLNTIAVALCTILTVTVSITAMRKSMFETLTNEFDVAEINEDIIQKAKEMGERMRFTNAANLTFALTCACLSALAIALCCLPIGMEKVSVKYGNKDEFIAAVQGDYNIKIDWSRQYDPEGTNVEVRTFYDNGELTHIYVVQETTLAFYEGIYFYGYYLDADGKADGKADSIFLELDDIASRIPCVEYTFGDESEWVFEVHGDEYSNYTFDKTDGSISCIIDAEEFGGYNLLIGLVAGAVGVSGACAVILFAFAFKLRKVKGE